MDLVVIGVLASAASAYYYLRVLVALFMTGAAAEDEDEVAHRRLDTSGAAVIAVSAGLLVIMGLWPALMERVASLL